MHLKLETSMAKHRKKTIRRTIPLTKAANDYLNWRAEQLGISGAEYARRLLFLECWDGIVYDDLRAIEAQIVALHGQPLERALPYEKVAIERLRCGLEEVRALRDLVTTGILPALDEAERKLTATLQQKEVETARLVAIHDMAVTLQKLSGKEET
jgi:hypothetical protein